MIEQKLQQAADALPEHENSPGPMPGAVKTLEKKIFGEPLRIICIV